MLSKHVLINTCYTLRLTMSAKYTITNNVLSETGVLLEMDKHKHTQTDISSTSTCHIAFN